MLTFEAWWNASIAVQLVEITRVFSRDWLSEMLERGAAEFKDAMYLRFEVQSLDEIQLLEVLIPPFEIFDGLDGTE